MEAGRRALIRREPLEIALLVTIAVAAWTASASYSRIERELADIKRHSLQAWTLTEQHLFVTEAQQRLSLGEDLPSAYEIHAAYLQLQPEGRP